MDDLPVIRADFATWRPVQGRKVIQLIFEIGIEQTHEVLTKLGVPLPGESKWCAIALLDENNSTPSLRNEAEKAPEDGRSSSGAAPKERKPFNTLPLSQQAAMRCQDADFRTFLARDCVQVRTWDSDTAADLVRRACQVQSRSEIKSGGPSGDLWLKLEAQFQAWLTDRKYSEARR